MDDTKTRPILILGATSAIAAAYARLCAGEGALLVLAGRRRDRLALAASDLEARGATSAAVFDGDLADLDDIERQWNDITRCYGVPAEICIAYGALGDMQALKDDASALRAHLETNYVSAAMWLELAAKAMEDAGGGRIVAIGSVAGDRGRQSNYPYGAAKGALERHMEGLAHRFALGGDGLSAHLVKPGFVDTPMTDGMDKGGPLWATPEQIASAMRKGVAKGKRVIYAPWFWRFIMMIIKAVPAFVLHKTKL